MSVLIVGNILKDVYLNLDSRTEKFETDKNGVRWLDISFDASEHHFFSRNCSLGGAAVSLEVLQKLGVEATISDSRLNFNDNEPSVDGDAPSCRYILISDETVSYLAPSNFKKTDFLAPAETVDYLYIDRSAEIDSDCLSKINAYLELASNTKLVLFVKDFKNKYLNSLIPRADLLFLEKNRGDSELPQAPEFEQFPRDKVVSLAENELCYLDVREKITLGRVDMLTHLSAYSIAAATVLGCFILGESVENSLKFARANMENSRLDAVLPLEELKNIASSNTDAGSLELIAKNLVLKPKGILAADESGGSIKKKFAQLDIPDTYDTRRDYRNIFLSAPDLEKYVNGVILFDETTRQLADNGQDFVSYLTARRIIPGIKVDQGLEKFPGSTETYTKGLDGLEERLKEYYARGLRFTKWRAAFELQLGENGEILTPTEHVTYENCRILAEYARKVQQAEMVPIVEPELVYDGYYNLEDSAKATGKILDSLFKALTEAEVNLAACILKVNMVLAGKQFETQSTPEEVGRETARILKEFVPEELAGVVFLSGGQTAEQATNNLAEIIKNGPFPWPVTFSFARALQDPALYAWAGNNENIEKAKSAFIERLILNCEAL